MQKFFVKINMGEGGRKLEEGSIDELSIEEQIRRDVKKSGTRRIPINTEYSLGRGAVSTERPGIFEDDDEEDVDKTKVDIPRQTTLRPIEGVVIPSSPENELAEEEPADISDKVVAWVNTNMASEHPSSPRNEKLPTIVDPIVAKAKFHEAGVEDDLPSDGTVLIDSEQLPNVIDFRKKQQEKVMGIVLKGGVDYAWPWWESSDSLVRVWGELNSLRVLPDWKFRQDLQSLIQDEAELDLCMRVYNGKISFVKFEIEKALLKCFPQAEILARCAQEKDLFSAKKMTSK